MAIANRRTTEQRRASAPKGSRCERRMTRDDPASRSDGALPCLDCRPCAATVWTCRIRRDVVGQQPDHRPVRGRASTGSTGNSLCRERARPACHDRRVARQKETSIMNQPQGKRAAPGSKSIRQHAHCTHVRRIERGGNQRLQPRGCRRNSAACAGGGRGQGGVQAGARMGRVHRSHHRGGDGRAARPRQRLCRARRLSRKARRSTRATCCS